MKTTQLIQTYLSVEAKAQLKELARQDRQDMAVVIEKLITAEIRRRERKSKPATA